MAYPTTTLSRRALAAETAAAEKQGLALETQAFEAKMLQWTPCCHKIDMDVQQRAAQGHHDMYIPNHVSYAACQRIPLDVVTAYFAPLRPEVSHKYGNVRLCWTWSARGLAPW